MAYTTTRSANIDGGNVRALTETADILNSHGIRVPDDVTEALTRHKQVIDHIASVIAETDADMAGVEAARALADGEGTAQQLLTAAAATSLTGRNPQTAYRKIIDRAKSLAAHDLRQVFATHGDQWVTKILRPRITKAVNVIVEATQYAPQYDAFREPNAADNWLSNPAVNEAWTTLRDLYRVARKLRQFKVIPSTFQRDDTYEWTGTAVEYTTQKAGDTLTASVRDNIRDGNLTWFLMGIQYGLTPTLLTEKETSQQ
ncbi:hypothetical protein V6S02_05995 [Microbacterium sp. CCNWLW134]|uniref:hypothetical protein n=1 Tax=Microbacterium sp. CCNWLW134 TaxID=3122064 RepID=UPI00300F9941